MTTVYLASEAVDDLVEIHRYVEEHDLQGKADVLLSKLESTCLSLSNHPERGHAVPELKRIYVTEFREIHSKPDRIIYQIREEGVFVHAVLDGRRDVRDLLEYRVLR